MNFSQEKPNIKEKYARLEQIKKEVEGAKDALAKGLDPEIKDTVVALNALEVCTVQSCGGHLEKSGTIAPWVEIAAPNEPRYQYHRQKEIFEEVAKENGVPVEEVEKGYPSLELWKKARAQAEKEDETKEHIAWRQKSKRLGKRVQQLLDEFYRGRKSEPDVKLTIEEQEEGDFRLHNGGSDYLKNTEVAQKKSLEGNISERQKLYRQEMQDFAKFLERKFLGT